MKPEFSQKLLKNLFELLEHKSPHKIVLMVEAVVGVLRNQTKVSNIDVEVRFFIGYKFFVALSQKAWSFYVQD